MVLKDASAVKLGSSEVSKVYLGTTLVYTLQQTYNSDIVYDWSYEIKSKDVYLDNKGATGDTNDALAYVCAGLEFTGTQYIDVDTTGISSLWIYDYGDNTWHIETSPINPFRIENRTIGHYFTLNTTHTQADADLLNANPMLCLDLVLGATDTGLSFDASAVASYMQPDVNSGKFLNDLKATNTTSTITFDTTEANQVVAPGPSSSYYYNCVVDWGDGTIDKITSYYQFTHTYADIGTYTMTITGAVGYISFYNKAPFNAESTVFNMGDNGEASCAFMFYYVNSNNIDILNMDMSNNTDCKYMLRGCSSFNQPIGTWDMSNNTNCGYMLAGCSSFNQPIDSWDMSNNTNCYAMLRGCSSFNQPINSWDMSNNTNCGHMLEGCSSFNQPIDSWDMSNNTNCGHMLEGCSSFNQPIDSWDMSNNTNCGSMLNSCSSFDQSLAGWNISNIENMSYMLYNTTISTANYDATLISWANQTRHPNLTEIHFGNAKYTPGGDAEAARQALIDSGITIYDGGPA